MEVLHGRLFGITFIFVKIQKFGNLENFYMFQSGLRLVWMVSSHCLASVNEILSFFFQVNDRCALSQSVKEEMYKCYPNAKRAHLKDGGNFPYMSRSAEVNVYIQVSS